LKKSLSINLTHIVYRSEWLVWIIELRIGHSTGVDHAIFQM
jgi:hypothetical protein